MKVLKKRTCSFRPTPEVKVMLVEAQALITALEYPLTLEEVINAALKAYLPPLILSLRKMSEGEKNKILLKFIRTAENFLKGEPIEIRDAKIEQIREDFVLLEQKEDEEIEEENFVDNSLLGRLK
jgi:hypothetical protein